MDSLKDRDVVVGTTGMLSRELFEYRVAKGHGHEKDFLTVGSMGHASAIALGIAQFRPKRQVYFLIEYYCFFYSVSLLNCCKLKLGDDDPKFLAVPMSIAEYRSKSVIPFLYVLLFCCLFFTVFVCYIFL